jgi:phosphoglycolate phosphatase-like HAD superfamily hydrolase
MRYRHIIFDFDGILVETNQIRLDGFRILFSRYFQADVEQLMTSLMDDGGRSRYDRIRYFLKEIGEEDSSGKKLQVLVQEYSKLVKEKVISAPAVKGSLRFLKNYAKSCDFAIVSSSDQEELREICRTRGIDHFFVEMLGSPISKEENVIALLLKKGWKRKDCLFIGDSINDLKAAQANGVDFMGRDSNLADWQGLKDIVVFNNFSELELQGGRR